MTASVLHRGEVRACSENPEVLAAWRGDVPFGAPLAADAIGYDCGRIGLAGAPPHEHEADEVELCQRRARACAAAMRGALVEYSDEGEHEWFPFSAPALAGQSAPAAFSIEVLLRACGGALSSELDWGVRPLSEELADMREDPSHSDEFVAACERLLELMSSEPTVGVPVYVSPRQRLQGAVLCVPHFYVAMTGKGSLFGVFGLTAWT